VFHQLEHPERDYGKVRLWGTVGWASASLLLGAWIGWTGAELVDSIRLAAIFSLLTACYSLTLPHTPPSPRLASAPRGISCLLDAPVTAFRLMRRRSFAIYAFCLFGTYVTLPFPTQLNPLLLRELGVAETWIPPALTIAQSSEIATLALLPVFLTRLQIKPTMVLGIGSWALGLIALAWGRPLGLVLGALATHGVYICCFLVSGQVFVNRNSGHGIRASAQGMIQLIAGLGLLSGHLLVGWLRQRTGDNYVLVYTPAAVASVGLALTFAMGFTAKDDQSPGQDAIVPSPEMT
jgi:hypothetical protein